MTYATVDHLKAVIPPGDLALLTDWDGTVDAPDDARLLSALEDATATVNGWIAKRVRLPLADPPQMLKVVTRDLALHRLYANTGGIIPDAVKALHDGAMAYLKDVARGEVSIGDEVAGNTAEASPGAVLDEGGAPVFTRETLKGY
jgi:phage gp36-like protein